MAGSDNQDQCRIDGEKVWPGFEKGRFFPIERAARHNQAQPVPQGRQEPCSFRGLGGTHIEFEVAGD